jgi:transforming growth factor-beta-induced protein
MFLQIIKQNFVKVTLVLSFLSILTSPVVSAAAGDIVDVASNASQFSTLVAAVKAADLVTTLQGAGPFTVVAPTNAAFEALPVGVLSKLLLPVNKPELVKILKYHVISGNNNSTALTTVANSSSPANEVATVEGSKLKFTVSGNSLKINTNTTVTAANISATNGVIHQIDTVLLPPTFSVSSLKEGAGNNIVQTAIASPSFSTLVTAVKAAGLVDTLSGTGPFTVFAPTNDAFAKVPADVLSKLLLPENKDALVKVLTYHVVAGKVDAAQVVKLTSAKTVQGSDVKIAVVDGKVKLNDKTTVLTTDIQTSNGIIHSIDSVLLPADLDLTKLTSVETASNMKVHTVRTGGFESTSVLVILSVIILGFVLRLSLRSEK